MSSSAAASPSHPSLDRVEHRPWALPAGPWSWTQSWMQLLFAHWRVPAEVLAPLVPAGLTLQQRDGSAWLGVVPFLLAVRPRLVPPLPRVSLFPEINVRTYVECEGKPGVWFLSLDARNPLAVWAARRFFHLPYYRARMHMRIAGGGVHYSSVRRSARSPNGEAVAFEAEYEPRGEVAEAAPGSLEHWLTARYCLYAQSPDGALHRAEVHHAPWPLQDANARIAHNSLGAPVGIRLPDERPLLHFASRVDVAIWPLRRLG